MKKHAVLVSIGVLGAALSGWAVENKNLVRNPGFEQGLPGYMEQRGRVALDYDVAHKGLVCLKLDADSESKSYSGTSTKPMSVNAGKGHKLSCYVKTDSAIDGDGFYALVLQEKPGKVLGWWPNGGNVKKLLVTKEATDGWVKKEMILDGFLPGTTKAKIYFRLKGKGTVYIDDISLEEVEMAGVLIDDFSTDEWRLNLGREFPGAKASKKLSAVEFVSAPSAMSIDYDLTAGGRYVRIERSISIPEKVKAISFQAKITAENSVFALLIDAKGEHHRSGTVALKKTDEWQEMTFAVNKKSFSQHWGGGEIGKGKIDFPVKKMWIAPHLNDKKAKAEGKAGQKGTLYVDDLTFHTLD